jgi:hypothetical protein
MGTLDFILGLPAKYSPDRSGLLAEVLFQQRAVLDGGIRMERAAGVGQLEVQRAAVIRAGHAGHESGFLQAVNNLGDSALGHGSPLARLISFRRANWMFPFTHTLPAYSAGSPDMTQEELPHSEMEGS